MSASARALGLVASLVFGLSISSSLAFAQPPLQEWIHRDFTNRLNGASRACGFDVFGHFEGDLHWVVFYDRSGAIDRKVDTASNFTVTVWAPSTGKSYTTVSAASLHTQYTNGAAVGSTATAELTGLLEKFDGVAMDGGRLVFSAVVVGYDAAGVPLIDTVSTISSSGPDIEGT